MATTTFSPTVDDQLRQGECEQIVFLLLSAPKHTVLQAAIGSDAAANFPLFRNSFLTIYIMASSHPAVDSPASDEEKGSLPHLHGLDP